MSERWLADSGLETWLVFKRSFDLPDFASFPLLDTDKGRAALEEYVHEHVALAAATGVGVVVETPTWRASADWGARLGYDAAGLDRVNQAAVALVRDVAGRFAGTPVVVSGNLGPRGDGYAPTELLSPEEAEAYHRPQIESFAAAGADRITLVTATHAGEAIGVVRAATAAGLPVVVSFTVETDGLLWIGEALSDAIAAVDEATEGAALHFGVNCAHPDHFTQALDTEVAAARVRLLRANASRASHAELDEAEVLDEGDPAELASQYAALVAAHPQLEVLGGCCGTDIAHMRAIAAACFAASR